MLYFSRFYSLSSEFEATSKNAPRATIVEDFSVSSAPSQESCTLIVWSFLPKEKRLRFYNSETFTQVSLSGLRLGSASSRKFNESRPRLGTQLASFAPRPIFMSDLLDQRSSNLATRGYSRVSMGCNIDKSWRFQAYYMPILFLLTILIFPLSSFISHPLIHHIHTSHSANAHETHTAAHFSDP